VLNYNDASASVAVAGAELKIEPYGIERIKLPAAPALRR
jgi:hypothetical protein